MQKNGWGGDMTVGELAAALKGVPPEQEAVIYADLQGEWRRPFSFFEERATVCGYFAVEAVCGLTDATIVMVGDPLPL